MLEQFSGRETSFSHMVSCDDFVLRQILLLKVKRTRTDVVFKKTI
jgi:hypothetical protein